MPRKSNTPLSSRTARATLERRDKPHRVEVIPGKVRLGWRSTSSAWIGYFYVGDGKYDTVALGAKADDRLNPTGADILNYEQAVDKVRKLYAERQAGSSELTIAAALDAYEKDLETRGGDTGNVTRVKMHLGNLASKLVAKVETKDLRRWRDGLTSNLAAATVNRTCNGLMAALNLAADLDKTVGSNREAWRTGIKAIPDAEESNNVILSEPVVRTLIENAASQGDEFQLLVDVLATTGARYSQAANLQVRDLQDADEKPRLTMPVSRKGRGTKQVTHRSIPISESLATRLRKAADGRPQTGALLRKKSGEPWRKSDHSRLFARVVKAAGLDPAEVTIYALRHSWIVRQILAGVPARVVAAAADTSIAMIEKTYSANISDHSDELLRASVLDVSTPMQKPAVA
jgi:integrase